MELISVNNIITIPGEAKIPAMDRGFLFADSIFEVLVAFHGKILDLEAHLSRLRRSASDIALVIPWSDEELKFELEHLVTELQAPKGYLRLTITRGCGMGISIPDDSKPTKVIYALKARTEPPEFSKIGIRLKRRRHAHVERGAHPKTANYARSILAVREAQLEGFDDILWTNGEGEFTECSTANVFFIGRSGDQVEICTPAEISGILPGITRATILKLLRAAKIPVQESVIYGDELARFDEAFVCSTVRGLIPVSAVDKHQLHSARQNSIFRKIESLHATWVETQVGWRVDWNTGSKVKNSAKLE